MIKWPYIQSSAMDVSRDGAAKALARFDALRAELATIGATLKPIVAMTHDDVHLEVDCPKGHEYEARVIMNKYFPPT